MKKQPTVQKVTLSDKRTKLRLALLISLLVIFAISLTVFLISFLNQNKGWHTITPSRSDAPYAGEIQLSYDIGKGEKRPAEEYREIEELYTEKLAEAYKVFSLDEDYVGVANFSTLSKSYNMEQTVSPLLYNTLKTMTKNTNRILYYAPVRSLYSNLFYCENDAVAETQDPHRSYALREDINKLLPYVMSDKHIRVEFLDDASCTVNLFISDEYLATLADMGIEEKISLGIFELAFVVDYVAQAMIDLGYTDGLLTTYNGYMRNLGTYDQSFRVGIQEGSVGMQSRTVAELCYTGALSMVVYRNYPTNALDKTSFYVYEDGTVVSPYIDSITGLNEELALDDMVFYSKKSSCAELALLSYPYFASSALMGNEINALTSLGIYTVYTMDAMVFYNEALLLSDDYLKITLPAYNKSYLIGG